MPGTRKREAIGRRLGKAKLDALVTEATADCYNEDEQRSGLLTMIQDNLKLPFETTILGVPVQVQSVDFNKGDEIVAICVRGRDRQSVPILDLPLPSPPPKGAEWIETYRHWAAGAR
jgi:hypothetical protein